MNRHISLQYWGYPGFFAANRAVLVPSHLDLIKKSMFKRIIIIWAPTSSSPIPRRLFYYLGACKLRLSGRTPVQPASWQLAPFRRRRMFKEAPVAWPFVRDDCCYCLEPCIMLPWDSVYLWWHMHRSRDIVLQNFRTSTIMSYSLKISITLLAFSRSMYVFYFIFRIILLRICAFFGFPTFPPWITCLCRFLKSTVSSSWYQKSRCRQCEIFYCIATKPACSLCINTFW